MWCLRQKKVSRELSRNCDKRSWKYDYQLAHRKHRKRIKEKHKHIRFTQEIKDFIETHIREDMSPEQMVGIAKKESKRVSHKRIYQHI